MARRLRAQVAPSIGIYEEDSVKRLVGWVCGLQASIRCHEQIILIYFGTTNHLAVDPIHLDGFRSHAI